MRTSHNVQLKVIYWTFYTQHFQVMKTKNHESPTSAWNAPDLPKGSKHTCWPSQDIGKLNVYYPLEYINWQSKHNIAILQHMSKFSWNGIICSTPSMIQNPVLSFHGPLHLQKASPLLFVFDTGGLCTAMFILHGSKYWCVGNPAQDHRTPRALLPMMILTPWGWVITEVGGCAT